MDEIDTVFGGNYERIFEVLAAEGVDEVVLDFDGGGDDGGVRGVAVAYADGRRAELDPIRYDTQLADPLLGRAQFIDPALKPMARALEAMELPVYDRYGGFNNDPYVSGTLTYDVTARRVTMEADETTTEWYGEGDDDNTETTEHVSDVLYEHDPEDEPVTGPEEQP